MKEYLLNCLSSFTLTAPAAPTFTREPSDVSSDIGSNVTLSCHAQGYPEPRVTWRRDGGSPLFNGPRLHGSITQSKGDLQIISKLFCQMCFYLWPIKLLGLHLYVPVADLWVEDEAVYICEAQNHFGKIQTQASISVTGLGKNNKCKVMFFGFSTNEHFIKMSNVIQASTKWTLPFMWFTQCIFTCISDHVEDHISFFQKIILFHII